MANIIRMTYEQKLQKQLDFELNLFSGYEREPHTYLSKFWKTKYDELESIKVVKMKPKKTLNVEEKILLRKSSTIVYCNASIEHC